MWLHILGFVTKFFRIFQVDLYILVCSIGGSYYMYYAYIKRILDLLKLSSWNQISSFHSMLGKVTLSLPLSPTIFYILFMWLCEDLSSYSFYCSFHCIKMLKFHIVIDLLHSLHPPLALRLEYFKGCSQDKTRMLW